MLYPVSRAQTLQDRQRIHECSRGLLTQSWEESLLQTFSHALPPTSLSHQAHTTYKTQRSETKLTQTPTLP